MIPISYKENPKGYMNAWYKNKRKICKEKGLCICKEPVEPGKSRCRACSDKNAVLTHKRLIRVRSQVLEMYGWICKCCGESENMFLALDHIHGGGRKEREKYHGTCDFYWFVLKQGHQPERYQLLCHNCNSAKGFYGYCPHALSK